MEFKKLARIISEILDCEQDAISPQTVLAQSGLDSLGIARVIMQCEKIFHVSIADEDVHKFHIVGDIAAYIEERLEEAGSSAVKSERDRDGWFYGQ